ncbi:MAG TPA: hypothetical protein VHS28_10575 [Chloroflexota bacterium]|nr:hypothetical protein [Chloroflexota bacterium]
MKTISLVDTAILAGFLVTAPLGLMLWLVPDQPDASLGLPRRICVEIHELVAIATLVATTVHIGQHRRWISAMAGRLFGRLSTRARVNALVVVALFITFLAANLSGLTMLGHLSYADASTQGNTMPGFQHRAERGLGAGPSSFQAARPRPALHNRMNDLHPWAGLAMATVVAVHLGLHRRWLAGNTAARPA